MSATALAAPRFVRRTQLGPHEYRKNFRQIDDDVIAAVTSPEADAVTPLMSKIYLKLVRAPTQYRERDGVLHFTGEVRDDKHVTAWDALCELVGVASATARKALLWMHEQGIIGYHSGKNGVGIRIFLNRAASSIGTRAAGQKILGFPHASYSEGPASTNEAAFMDSFAVLEYSDTGVNPRAQESDADVSKKVTPPPTQQLPTQPTSCGRPCTSARGSRGSFSLDEVVRRLLLEIGPSVHRAASTAASREHERTREWLENRGLPKVARVAQREAYDLLRKFGVVRKMGSTSARVGVSYDDDGPAGPRLLSVEEVEELAQSCVAMLLAQGRSIEHTLSEMSADAGGFMLPGDAARVRERAEALLAAGGDERGGERGGDFDD